MKLSTIREFVMVILVLVAALMFSVTCEVPLSSATRDGFVSRAGTRLLLNGQTFRFSGANIYWLGLDENVYGISYPTHFRIDDALATAQEMGETVVRSHTLGTSVGCPLCIEPALNSFNTAAFATIDYAIKSAHDHGIQLIMPFTDNWHYYHGGKHTFTDWRGIAGENQFYYNPTVINDFEQYMTRIIEHVNIYTGVAYKNDPTILAWETGNEITPPVSWTQTIADKIKSLDSHHLIIDGTRGINNAALSLANVDIYSDHFYPISTALVDSDAQAVKAANKIYIVGEYDWENRVGGDPLGNFLSAIETNGTEGDMLWSLFAHNDLYGYVQHNDGYTLHYPGDTPDMRNRVQLLRMHAYRMRFLAPPPPGIPGLPVITNVIGKRIFWRGTAVANTYTVERATSSSSGPWTIICNQCATDNDTPWVDLTQPAGLSWYRLKAVNLSSVSGPFSLTYRITR